MSDPISTAACRALLGKSADGMTNEQVEKLRDALYGISETLCAEIMNVPAESIHWQAFLANATEKDMAALAIEDAQYAEFLASQETDDMPVGFVLEETDRKPN